MPRVIFILTHIQTNKLGDRQMHAKSHLYTLRDTYGQTYTLAYRQALNLELTSVISYQRINFKKSKN